MPRKRYHAEEIIPKLREAEVPLPQEKSVSEGCRQIGVTDNTYLSLAEGVRRGSHRSGEAIEGT